MKEKLIGMTALLILSVSNLTADNVDDAIELMNARAAAKAEVSLMSIYNKDLFKNSKKAKQHIVKRCNEDPDSKESERYRKLCINLTIDLFNKMVVKKYKIVK